MVAGDILLPVRSPVEMCACEKALESSDHLVI